MPGTIAIHEFLRGARVPYTVVPHRPAFTAQEEAAAAHVHGRHWAKVVVCVVDGEPIEAVIPAPSTVRLDQLLELTGGREIHVAEEDEIRRNFPGCDHGAVTPLGPVYGRLVFADAALAAEPEIVFSAGTHVDAIAMRWADFARTVKPIVGKFAGPPTDRVPEYRLSYRE
jgi:Ala-tRNA(Pro) deacylase